MPWHECRSACCHAPIEWSAVDTLLSFACPLHAARSQTLDIDVEHLQCASRHDSHLTKALDPEKPWHPRRCPRRCLAERCVERSTRMTVPFDMLQMVIVAFVSPRAMSVLCLLPGCQ